MTDSTIQDTENTSAVSTQAAGPAESVPAPAATDSSVDAVPAASEPSPREKYRSALEERDAVIADLRAFKSRQDEIIDDLKTQLAAAQKVAADRTAERDKFSAKIKELRADAKSAERIAAEKYGAGVKPAAAPAASPAGDPNALREKIRNAYGNAAAMRAAISGIPSDRLNNILMFRRG